MGSALACLTSMPYYLYGYPASVREPMLSSDWGQGHDEVYREFRSLSSLYPIRRQPAACLECMLDDEHVYGHSWWRRSHQLRGVTRCHIHGTALSIGCRICGPWMKARHHLTLPSSRCQCGTFAPLLLSQTEIANPTFSNVMARVAHEMLQDENPIDSSSMRELFIAEVCRRHGEGEQAWCSAADDLRAKLTGHHEYMKAKALGNITPQWLSRLCHRSVTRLMSDHVLLLIAHFFGSVATMRQMANIVREDVLTYKQLESPPVSCEVTRPTDSSLADLYRKHASFKRVCLELGVSKRTAMRAAGRHCPEAAQGCLTQDQRILVPAIRQLCEKGFGVEAIAKQVDVRTTVVYKVLRLMPDLDDTRRAAIDTRRRDQGRNFIVKICTKGGSIQEIRRGMPGGWKRLKWLLKHDRAWVEAHLPARRVSRNKFEPTPFDWETRDREWAFRVPEIVQSLMAKQRRRITRVGRFAVLEVLGWHRGTESSSVYNLIPLTVAAMDRYCESATAHMLRRVVRRIEKCLGCGGAIRRRKLCHDLEISRSELERYLWLAGRAVCLKLKCCLTIRKYPRQEVPRCKRPYLKRMAA